ncbi:MAG: DegQ family serine endoprotease [Aestuariivirga sp.]|uniref:DegQ family serine endoprotease n=1 Tax=Aestuariivirga sp. TaxID=2650926 RepID=UPI0025BCEA56|nr:DegQ family serine endoprotease [Aestuariivirga sp.]MCA3562060.1 DegQ family serine endoprotease [Aestuariivirga sp.]
MSGKIGTVRSLALAAAIGMLSAAAVQAQTAAQPAQDLTATPLQELPSVADLADRLLPAVVEITIESGGGDGADTPDSQQDTPDTTPENSPGSGNPDDPNNPFKDFFDEFLKRGQGGDQPKQKMTSMGSGFVVDASGVIVTNNHVVEGAESIEVHFHDDTILKGELVGRDPKTDLAVIRVKPKKPLPTVAFGDSDKLRVGEWVMAIGNPFGLGGSVSLGIVSARNRDINAGPYDDFIQTDAAINKGNSGGPLFNLKGQVMGINTAIFSPSGGSVGIGFSVPSNTAKNVISQLIQYGETRRGWLGVKIQAVTDEIAESLALGNTQGALVADITAGGPAEKAGLQPGDIIVEFNGRPVTAMRDLPKIVAETPIGEKAPLKVLRKGKEVALTAEVGRLEDGEKMADASGAKKPQPAAPAVVTVLGMTVTSITDELRTKFGIDKDLKGAVITEVAKDGPAADKRLEPGDVITEAGEQDVLGAADISARVGDAKKAGKSSILLLIAKGGKSGEMRFIAVKLKE